MRDAPLDTQARPVATGWRLWMPVLVMMGCSFLSYLDRQVLAILSPTILRETGLNTEKYAIVVGFFSFAYMAGNPLWGIILDRIGLRRGMSLSVGIWSIASASHAALSSFWGFALARATLGLGEGATFPGGLRTATDSLPHHLRSRGMALAYSGGSLGAIMTPLLVTPISLAWGWRAAFLLTGLFGAVWLAVWRWASHPGLLPETHRHGARLALPKVTEGRFWALVCGYAMGGLPLAPVLYLAPLYLSRVLGFNQADLGKVLWIPPLGWEIGYFFWGWVLDRFATNEPRPVWLFFLLGAGSIPLSAIVTTQNAAIVLAMLFFSMFVAAGFVVASLRCGTMSYPREHVALVAGIGAGSWSALVALMLPLLGRLFDHQQYAGAFLIVSLTPLAGVIGWWLFSRQEAAGHLA